MILKYSYSLNGLFCHSKNVLKCHRHFPINFHLCYKSSRGIVSCHHLLHNNLEDGKCEHSKYFQGPFSINHAGYKTFHFVERHILHRQPVCCFSSKNELPKDDSIVEKEKDYSESEAKPEKKLSLVQRYKKMLKEYWYVLIPVHIATSLVWFGSFYYAALLGIDIVPFLEAIGVSETIIHPLKNSSLGYIAVASAMYKLATPLRYMVTLGGTTLTIKLLTKRGLLKPVPTKEQFKTLVKNKLGSNKRS